MRITTAELSLITNPRIHRRMMRLPLERGPLNELRKCPVKHGHLYTLRAGQGTVKVTVMDPPRRERLAALTLADARREGFAGVRGALDAWARTHGEPRLEDEVWVVSFELGDRTQSFDTPVLLARRGDYTTSPSESVSGEGEVLMPLAKDLAKARAKALERRVSPQREAISRATGEVEKLHGSLEAMKARNRLRRIEHDLKKLALELPSDAVIDFGVRPACDEPHMDAGSPLSRGALETPDGPASLSPAA